MLTLHYVFYRYDISKTLPKTFIFDVDIVGEGLPEDWSIPGETTNWLPWIEAEQVAQDLLESIQWDWGHIV